MKTSIPKRRIEDNRNKNLGKCVTVNYAVLMPVKKFKQQGVIASVKHAVKRSQQKRIWMCNQLNVKRERLDTAVGGITWKR